MKITVELTPQEYALIRKALVHSLAYAYKNYDKKKVANLTAIKQKLIEAHDKDSR